MAHPFAPDPAVRNLDAAAVADNAFELCAFVFSAGAFPVLLRSENPLAEKTILLRPICPIVNGLRLFHLAERPAPDIVRAGQ